MITIKGRKFLTLHAEAGETYEIDYGTPPKLSIANHTGAELYIGYNAELTEDGTAGEYLTLPAATAANDMRFSFSKVYIKPESSGDIVIGGA